MFVMCTVNRCIYAMYELAVQLLSYCADMVAAYVIGISVFVTATSFVYLLLRGYRRWRLSQHLIPARDISKGHRWCLSDSFREKTECSMSGRRLLDGLFCDSCGITVDGRFAADADLVLKCKALADTNRNHHWVKGGLPENSYCDVCMKICEQSQDGEGLGTSLASLPAFATELPCIRCIWCQRTVHAKCSLSLSAICDLGTFKDFIIPPSCIKLRVTHTPSGRKYFVVDSVISSACAADPADNSCTSSPNSINILGPDWSPLIVMANKKSGNGLGESVLSSFRTFLNPVQVIDLSEIPPECALEWCHLLPKVTCRILVAGGDGTIGWVLQAIDKLQLNPTPEVAILPLGTGNDLSRVLGWGPGHDSEVNVRHIMKQLQVAQPVKLDRWKVQITPVRHFGFRMPKKVIYMTNYASIGVDAKVALNFHQHRESTPSMFGSRLLNKFWYFTYGTKDILERECKNLNKRIRLELDGKPVDLPSIEGIVILNIESWGGGCRPWTIGQSTQAANQRGDGLPNISMQTSYGDKKLEVFALYSSFHIAQLQVGLAEPLRLGQANHVKITLHGGNAPFQIDGEPWEQTSSFIEIFHHNQTTMLAKS